MPRPPALREEDDKHPPPGTFVPSQEHVPSGVRTVRRAIFGPEGDLFVADRDADCVKRYHGQSGRLQREYQHHHLSRPVHLLFRDADGALLVGSRDQHAIFAIETNSGETTTLVEPGAGGLQAPAGMAFGPDGKLYVSSRETKQILRYDATSGEPDSAPFIDELEDFPEFIALVG
jgi:sugar lactone lactonase YvrE